MCSFDSEEAEVIEHGTNAGTSSTLVKCCLWCVVFSCVQSSVVGRWMRVAAGVALALSALRLMVTYMIVRPERSRTFVSYGG